MNTLWPMGEGTVREIRDRLAERRPRAYTTIMTIMDRLARKGVVERRKSGRAYIYVPNLTAQDARAQALRHVVEGFFGGSEEELLAALGASVTPPRPRAAVAGAAARAVAVFPAAPPASASLAAIAPEVGDTSKEDSGRDADESTEKYFEAAERIDDTLL